MPRISAIIPSRNRSGQRLDNCLRSLRWQDVPAASLEIVLVDFGSHPDHAASVAEVAAKYNAVLVRVEDTGLWNRSRALNIGIQSATGELCFCTDADMIFAPNFVSQLLEASTAEADNALILCRCHDLAEGAVDGAVSVADYPKLRETAEVRDTSGTGACQVARRDFFVAVRGYDEAFKFWGAEDNDMVSRARRFGLSRVWLGEDTAMLHQWHATTKNDRPIRRKLNSWRYKLTRHIVVKNRKRWGLELG